jgi:hypothetical protein
MSKETEPTPAPEPGPESEEPDGEEPEADTRALGRKISELVEAEAAELEAESEPELELERAVAAAVVEHHARIVGLVGPEVELVACPVCLGVGYDTVGLRQDPYTRRCDACGGRGITKTDSLVDSRATRTCGTCQGNGFIEAAPELGAGIVPPPSVSAPVILPPSMLPQPDNTPAPSYS